MEKIDEKIVSDARGRVISAGNFLFDAELDLERLVDLLETNLVSGKITEEMMAFYPIAKRALDAINSFHKFSYLALREKKGGY
ncbi:MAG: hypothetical protein IJ730_01865 [Alphaproteobacteria bacterium]|nr:hypothetical protein [Alphaproteobacteria bacterium]